MLIKIFTPLDVYFSNYIHFILGGTVRTKENELFLDNCSLKFKSQFTNLFDYIFLSLYYLTLEIVFVKQK